MFGFFKRMTGRDDVGEARSAASESALSKADGPVIVCVTLPDRVPLRGQAVLDELHKTYGARVGKLATADGDADTIAVDAPGGGFLAMAMMPAPIPWRDLEGPCATAWHWP